MRYYSLVYYRSDPELLLWEVGFSTRDVHSDLSMRNYTAGAYDRDYTSDGLEALHYYARENSTIIVTPGNVATRLD